MSELSRRSRRLTRRDRRSPRPGSSSSAGASCTRGSGRTAQLVDWPTYQQLRRRDRARRPRALPRLRGRVPAGRAARRSSLPSARRDYASTFAWLMAVCGVALVAVVARSRPEAAFYVALAPVLAGSLILSRFDLWPALLTAAALAALAARTPPARLGAARRRGRREALAARRSCRSRSSGRAAAAGGCAPFAGLAVAAAVFVPFARRRAARRLGQPQRPGVAAAADREPRRLALHDVRPSARRSARTARRTSPATARVARGVRRRCRSPSLRRALDRVRARPGDARSAAPLRRRVRLRVRRVRQGALAAVPALADPARAARRAAGAARRDRAPDARARADAGLVPAALLGLRRLQFHLAGRRARCATSRSSRCSPCSPGRSGLRGSA